MSRVLVALLAFALIAAACEAEEAPDVGGEPEEDVEPAEDVPQELTVGATEDDYTTEGGDANVGISSLNVNVYETLIRVTSDYELEPMLAEDWEFVEPNTWRFHLREDVTFHNGEPMDAEAVKEGLFDRVAAGGGGTILAGEDSAEVIDDYTIEFTPTRENRRVPEQIVHPNNSVLAPGTSADGEDMVGTGPFTFVSYAPEESISVERNADYWGDEPSLESITFRFFPEDSSRMLALEAGEIDLAMQTPRDDVDSLEAGGFEVAESEVGAYRAMFANIHGEEPYDLLGEREIRRAVAMAIDREAIVDEVLNGLATTDQTFVPPALLGEYADLIEGYEHDPEGAIELLEEAGWTEGDDGVRERDGRELRLTLVSGFGGADVHRPVPSVLESQLAEVGIAIEINEQPDSASYHDVLEVGEGDLFLEQGSQNDANPAFLPVLLFHSPDVAAPGNYQPWFAPGAEYDELIEPAFTQPEPEPVREATAEAVSFLVDQEAVVIPFAGIFNILAHDPSVQNFTPHPSSVNTRWDSITISD